MKVKCDEPHLNFAFEFNLRLYNPGSVVGQIAIMGSMPVILEYVGGGFGMPAVLGGASHGNGVDRAPRSQIPGRGLHSSTFQLNLSHF